MWNLYNLHFPIILQYCFVNKFEDWRVHYKKFKLNFDMFKNLTRSLRSLENIFLQTAWSTTSIFRDTILKLFKL